MKLENVRVYNIDKAIQGLHYFDGYRWQGDTDAGFGHYLSVYALARARAGSNKDEDVIPELNDILLYQDENEMCEYCAIGPRDMEMIKGLPPWRFATLRRNIFVTMDITATRDFWFNGRSFFFAPPSEPMGQDNYKVEVVTTYDFLKRIVDSEHMDFLQNDEWKFFISRIKCLPYAQDLIL